MRHEIFPNDPRGIAPRARLTLLCEVRQGLRPWKMARLTDLSETGFKLAWLPDYDPGKPLRIRIPGIEMLRAKVCWHEGKQASVRARGVNSGVGAGVFWGGACPTPKCGGSGGHRAHRYGGVARLQP